MLLRALTLAPVVALALAVPAAAPAQAAEQAKPVTQCVLDVSVAAPNPVCFASFSEAVARATGGRISNAPADGNAALRDSAFRARLEASNTRGGKPSGSRAAAADIVIGIEYEDSDFEDSRLLVTATSGCTSAETDWLMATLPAGWNDQIGSYQTFANCLAKHYEHINFTGVSTAYDAGQADMGWMDDEASSITWT
ncbi:hypothetical protein C6361_34165 [Plantactinospora sp. BC1]|uniref:hypothetical protein n=1 Tax=Plantactinospora sp. BC1 TaxID=2108470 RepID=UPI000D16D4C4|nr:hypothetical protein [Plantactinospora sp. BC1]AVT33658.1 hypothetical protein C6361_34165 [Plantactinospora sp. BC1]